MSLSGERIWVAGHTGMVGSAVVRALAARGVSAVVAPHAELDLTRQAEVERFIAEAQPDAIVIAAAKVGGILANDTWPADFLWQNLAIEANIFEAAHCSGVDRLLFLGSSCIYPRLAPQPIGEEALLTGPLEETNEAYAIAKIAGIKLADAYRRQHGRNYISAMPTNLYGPGDNFDLATSHVLPALIRKAHEAKLRGDAAIEVWGSGAPRREFLHVDDCADALLFLLEHYHEAGPINVGMGVDLTIRELAEIVCAVVGFRGRIDLDPSKPEGTPQKLLSSARLRAMGWSPAIGLRDGIVATYRWFLDHAAA